MWYLAIPEGKIDLIVCSINTLMLTDYCKHIIIGLVFIILHCKFNFIMAFVVLGYWYILHNVRLSNYEIILAAISSGITYSMIDVLFN